MALSETLIGGDMGMVMWVNDEESESLYQLAYNHDEIRK
jgi:hypothetical protein